MKKYYNKNNHRVDVYKITFIGDCNVGKTSIIKKYLYDQFDAQTESTIGASFSSISKEINNTCKKLDLWDTAGQERYRSIINIYYRNVDACIVVCDLSTPSSIESLEFWISDIHNKSNNNDVQIIIVANKVDILLENKGLQTKLKNLDRIRIPKRLREILNKYQYPLFITSVKYGLNINVIFESIYESLEEPFSYKQEDNNKLMIAPVRERRYFSFC